MPSASARLIQSDTPIPDIVIKTMQQAASSYICAIHIFLPPT